MSRIPATGVMTWNDIQNSFGGSNPIYINEYYSGGSFVTGSNLNSDIPTSGQIEAADFRGADGFSGTTGTATCAATGGKLSSIVFDSGTGTGSNLGMAFTTGSGVKVNIPYINGLAGIMNVASTTDSPATANTTNLNGKTLTASPGGSPSSCTLPNFSTLTLGSSYTSIGYSANAVQAGLCIIALVVNTTNFTIS